jgi:hypothetical protein
MIPASSGPGWEIEACKARPKRTEPLVVPATIDVWQVSDRSGSESEDMALPPAHVYRVRTRGTDEAAADLAAKRARNAVIKQKKLERQTRREAQEIEIAEDIKVQPERTYSKGSGLYRYPTGELEDDYVGVRSSHTQLPAPSLHPDGSRVTDREAWDLECSMHPGSRVPNVHTERNHHEFHPSDFMSYAARVAVEQAWTGVEYGEAQQATTLRLETIAAGLPVDNSPAPYPEDSFMLTPFPMPDHLFAPGYVGAPVPSRAPVRKSGKGRAKKPVRASAADAPVSQRALTRESRSQTPAGLNRAQKRQGFLALNLQSGADSDGPETPEATLNTTQESAEGGLITMTGPRLNISCVAGAAGPSHSSPSRKGVMLDTTPARWAKLKPREQAMVVAPWPDNVCCHDCWRWGRKSIRTFDSKLLCEQCRTFERACIQLLEEEKLEALTYEKQLKPALVRSLLGIDVTDLENFILPPAIAALVQPALDESLERCPASPTPSPAQAGGGGAS